MVSKYLLISYTNIELMNRKNKQWTIQNMLKEDIFVTSHFLINHSTSNEQEMYINNFSAINTMDNNARIYYILADFIYFFFFW